MLDARRLLMISGAPIGLAIGSAAWLMLNALTPGSAGMGDLTERLDALGAAKRDIPDRTPDMLVASLLSHPLLQTTTAGGAEPLLRLEGVSMTPTRSAALIAVGAGPAQWIQVGESRTGVTLRRVAPLSAVVESMSGEHSLALGGGGAASNAQPSPSPPDLAHRPPS